MEISAKPLNNKLLKYQQSTTTFICDNYLRVRFINALEFRACNITETEHEYAYFLTCSPFSCCNNLLFLSTKMAQKF